MENKPTQTKTEKLTTNIPIIKEQEIRFHLTRIAELIEPAGYQTVGCVFCAAFGSKYGHGVQFAYIPSLSDVPVEIAAGINKTIRENMSEQYGIDTTGKGRA